MSNEANNEKITHYRYQAGQQWNKDIFKMSGEANNGTRTYYRYQERPTMG
jgi:hypothetical protein